MPKPEQRKVSGGGSAANRARAQQNKWGHTMALIELHNITKDYPLGELTISVLKGVSLSIDKGEYVLHSIEWNFGKGG